MGCGASQPEEPEPEAPQEPSPEEIAKQKKAEEAAKINAMIAQKAAEKPVEASQPFERKFDGFKRHENRNRHKVKRAVAANESHHNLVRKSEMDSIMSKLQSLKAAKEAMVERMTSVRRTVSRRTTTRRTTRRTKAPDASDRTEHDHDEPVHGHGLMWDVRHSTSGVRRALTKRFTFRHRKSRETEGSRPTESKLFSGASGLDDPAYDVRDTAGEGSVPQRGTSKPHVSFQEAPGAAAAEDSHAA